MPFNFYYNSYNRRFNGPGTGLIIIITGLFLLFSSLMDYMKYSQLAKDGKAAVATVISYEPTYYHSRNGTTTHYWHVLSFDGMQQRVELQYGHDAGQKINIVYLPDKPFEACEGSAGMNTWQLMGEGKNITFKFFVAGGFVLIIVGALIFSKTYSQELFTPSQANPAMNIFTGNTALNNPLSPPGHYDLAPGPTTAELPKNLDPEHTFLAAVRAENIVAALKLFREKNMADMDDAAKIVDPVVYNSSRLSDDDIIAVFNTAKLPEAFSGYHNTAVQSGFSSALSAAASLPSSSASSSSQAPLSAASSSKYLDFAFELRVKNANSNDTNEISYTGLTAQFPELNEDHVKTIYELAKGLEFNCTEAAEKMQGGYYNKEEALKFLEENNPGFSKETYESALELGKLLIK